MTKIESDMIIADVLRLDRGLIPIFLRNGLHCLGCPSAAGETIEEACEVHGLDCNKLINELNGYFENK